VTDQRSVDHAAATIEQQYGKLDILVNNAGIALDWTEPSESDVEAFQETYSVNVFGVFRVTRAMLPLLRKSRGGRIVNVSSGLGSLVQAAEQNRHRLVAYCSSKAALNMMTVQFANELKPTAIKVNSANPGFTATDMNQGRGTRTVKEGAATPVWLALLPDDGPTGGCFSDQEPAPW
jgi:NAD(P)-dependent dehydrogenase (short-subunit alcohol dehydrogenase family)